jgi:hypothetical protein
VSANPEERAQAALDSNPDRVAQAFKAVFEHPQAGVVLAHLASICGATATVFDDNPFAMAANVGRQEVWHSIQTILSMDNRDINEIRNQVAAWGDAD